MTKIVSLKSLLCVAGAVATLGVSAAAQAPAVPNPPHIQFVPSAEVPTIPAGLQTA
jgi:hypothetical protein